VGLRFFSVYGLKEEFKGTYANIVTQFLWAIQKDKAPVVYGDGSQTRDFVNVKDVVESLMLSMQKNLNCEIFNVGTGKEHSFNEVVDKINRLLNKNVKPIYKPNPIRNYLYHTLADTTKSQNILQFKAKISLEEGIHSLISTLGRNNGRKIT
jgi:UDP-glucose 4-epimerase